MRSRYDLSGRIARGDHVVVCGAVDGGSLRSQGTRPAVLIATSKQGRPLAYVRAVVRGGWIRYAGCAISAIALCVEAAMW